MLLTILVAVFAGAAVPALQPKVTEALWRWMDERHLPDEAGRRVVTFAFAMACAAGLLWIVGIAASPVLLLAGGVVGYFQENLREAILARRK